MQLNIFKSHKSNTECTHSFKSLTNSCLINRMINLFLPYVIKIWHERDKRNLPEKTLKQNNYKQMHPTSLFPWKLCVIIPSERMKCDLIFYSRFGMYLLPHSKKIPGNGALSLSLSLSRCIDVWSKTPGLNSWKYEYFLETTNFFFTRPNLTHLIIEVSFNQNYFGFFFTKFMYFITKSSKYE